MPEKEKWMSTNWNEIRFEIPQILQNAFKAPRLNDLVVQALSSRAGANITAQFKAEQLSISETCSKIVLAQMHSINGILESER